MILNIYETPVYLSPTTMLVILCVLGFFIGLIALSMLIKTIKSPKKASGAGVVSEPSAITSPSPAGGAAPAPSSQGDIDLCNVDDHTAALLMAIVADDMKAELNTLRFISIRKAG